MEGCRSGVAWGCGVRRFPGAGEAGGLRRAVSRVRNGWRGAVRASVSLVGAGGRVRLKGSAMPGGQGLPGARTGFPGVGWVFPGSDGGAIFRRRGGCDGFCEVCGAFGRLSLRKTPAEAGVRDAACGLRTEGPASARGDSSGGYGLRLAPGPVPGSVGTDSGLFPKPVPIPGSIGPGFCSRVLSPGSGPPPPVPGPCYLRIGRMTRAGLPATMVSAGTSCVTTEPAPTMAFSPMVTPGSTTEQAPIQALRRMRIGRP